MKPEAEFDRSSADAADRYVSLQMRERRILLDLTQRELAELLGVTYQQVNKYEKGLNRITAGRLFTIAQALGVGVDYFVDGLENRQFPKTAPQKEMLELSRDFLDLSRQHQEAVGNLARAMAYPDLALIDDSDEELPQEAVAG